MGWRRRGASVRCPGRAPGSILALTAQAFSDQVEECRQAGMDGHLAKPFSPDMLNEAVANAATMRDVARAEPGAGQIAAPTGADMPINDQQVFDTTAAFLSRDAIHDHLRTLTAISADLLAGLAAEPAEPGRMAGLVHAAHTLAGSASMFGYVRLCSLCREFERGQDEPAAGRSRLVRDLRAALGARA